LTSPLRVYRISAEVTAEVCEVLTCDASSSRGRG